MTIVAHIKTSSLGGNDFVQSIIWAFPEGDGETSVIFPGKRKDLGGLSDRSRQFARREAMRDQAAEVKDGRGSQP
jgi:hypothetical protein